MALHSSQDEVRRSFITDGRSLSATSDKLYPITGGSYCALRRAIVSSQEDTRRNVGGETVAAAAAATAVDKRREDSRRLMAEDIFPLEPTRCVMRTCNQTQEVFASQLP